jgi:hypothetical protein
MMCDAAAEGRWNLMDRASGVPVPDKQSKRERGGERMGDARRGNPFVLTEKPAFVTHDNDSFLSQNHHGKPVAQKTPQADKSCSA